MQTKIVSALGGAFIIAGVILGFAAAFHNVQNARACGVESTVLVDIDPVTGAMIPAILPAC